MASCPEADRMIEHPLMVGPVHRSLGSLCLSSMDSEGVTIPKLVVEVSPDIARLARSLLPRALDVQPQKYAPHISVVRHEVLSDVTQWAKLDLRKPIEFGYCSWVFDDGVFFWLRAFSSQVQEIRHLLGLNPSSRWTQSPDGMDCFHITVGNVKHRRVG